MSEILIKQLAQRVVQHPDFQSAMVSAVGGVLQKVITEEYAGERFSLYAAKRPASQRRERDDSIRANWNGKNCEELAKRHSLTPRMVRKIAKGR